MSELGWYGRTWYDRRQNERLEELEGQIWAERSASRRIASRLQGELEKVKGGMQQQLNRLATAFDAFVELSDVSEELRAFQPATEARYHVRRLVTELLNARPSDQSLEPIEDLPGYWFPPAANALAAKVRGDDEAYEAALATALERDENRTEMFTCVMLLLSGSIDAGIERLDPLIDLRASEPITLAQQMLWHAAADGEFGPAGLQLVEQRLHGLVTGLSQDAYQAELASWRQVVEGLPKETPKKSRSYGGQTIPDIFLAPARAESKLRALTTWCASRLSPSDQSGPAADAESPADGDADQDVSGSGDKLLALMQELVDEGAPDEQPLLNRAAELRRVIESDGVSPAQAPVRWHNPLHDPLSELSGEARTAATPPRRALATRVMSPFLVAVADDLAAEANRPVPTEIELKVRGHVIRFGANGAVAKSVSQAEAKHNASFVTAAQPPKTLMPGAIALGVVMVVLGAILANPLLIIVGVAAAGGAAWWMISSLGRAKATAETHQHRWETTQREINNTSERMREAHSHASGVPQAAASTRSQLAQLLGAPATAN